MSLMVSLMGLYLGPCHNSVTTHPGEDDLSHYPNHAPDQTVMFACVILV
jgi:hypothetical protein